MFGSEEEGGIVPAIERLHAIGEILGSEEPTDEPTEEITQLAEYVAAAKPQLTAEANLIAELHKQLGSIQTDLESGAEDIAELAGDYLY